MDLFFETIYFIGVVVFAFDFGRRFLDHGLNIGSMVVASVFWPVTCLVTVGCHVGMRKNEP